MSDLTTSDRPPRGRLDPAAPALAAAALLTLGDMLSHRHGLALAAAVLVLVHVASRWSRVRTNARVMLVAAAGVGVLFLLTIGTFDGLALALSRTLYLPALLAAMTVLRVAARRSHQVGVAARFVVQQPPARRYAFLATGAHVLGILLNIGGFQLLLGIALAQRDLAALSPQAAAVRSRRVVTAIMRGFNATVLWSPVGVAMNLLIPLMPTLDWLGFLPYGLGLLVLFSLLGWAFDRMGPRPRVPLPPPPREGAWAAILALLALVVAITASAALLELALGVPMRAAVLMVIPAMALLWVLLTEEGPAAPRILSLGRETFHALPDSASEIGLLVATGFLGLVVMQMVPPAAVQALAESLALGPGMVGVAIALVIPVVSLLGISPMIGGSVCAGAVIAAGLPIPEPMLLVATLGGWVAAAMLSPMTSTVAIAAAVAGQSSATVGWRWNGLFTATFLAAVTVALLVWERLL